MCCYYMQTQFQVNITNFNMMKAHCLVKEKPQIGPFFVPKWSHSLQPEAEYEQRTESIISFLFDSVRVSEML